MGDVNHDPLPRREVIGGVGAMAIGAIAGCSDDESGDPTSNDSEASNSEISEPDPEPASLVLTGVNSPRSIDHSEPAPVTISLHNTGDETAQQTVTVTTGGETVATEDVTIAGGEQTELSIDIPADVFFSGEYDLVVTTDHDEATVSVTVDNPNPYGKQTLVVGLEQETTARHDMQEIVRNALAYWEANSETYAGYPIEYQYRANAADPDVSIRLVDDIHSCGGHTGEIAGCAPLVQHASPDTAEIRIVDGYRQEWMTTTLKHEFGHTLGLDHSDEPSHIMSDEIEDRIPDYAERRAAIDRYGDIIDPYGDGNDAWDKSLDAWSNQDYVQTESHAVDAHNYWLEALRAIEGARSVAEDIGDRTAYNRLTESYNHVEALRLAADEAIEMAREANRISGDPEPHREASNDYLDESQTYTLHTSTDITYAFGFPIRD